MSKYKLDKSAQVVENINYTMTQEEVCERLNDLEAKLVESEKEHELLIDDFEKETENLRKQIKQESDARKRFVEEVKNLKQQLAEKDDELTILKLDYEFVSKEYDKLVDIGVSKFKQHDQDKISFAVENLELLKQKNG